MGSFKHHSYFAKAKHIQSYLLPNVCFQCRKSFKKPVSEEPRTCPQCSTPLIALGRKFSVPRSNEVEQWHKIKLLVEHGFFFQPVYELRSDGLQYRAQYPQRLVDVQEFVVKFKAQALAKAF